ncbi:DUF4241 domain-containing protein [Streptomyces sp. NPDC093105]|uniref:DUF4241 domain-containing protein n=1 Tax=Streptomyces sp. NPDC093105 TaxID=3366029 RepID=UPI00380099AC
MTSDDMPRVLLEIAWHSHACTVWGFDDSARRKLRHDIRQLPEGNLILVQETEWLYTTEDQTEFDSTVPTRVSQLQKNRPAGGMMVITQDARSSASAPLADLTFDAPVFGDWKALASMGIQSAGPSDTPDTLHDFHVTLSDLPGAEWRPKQPLSQDLLSFALVERNPPSAPVAATRRIRPPWHPPQPLQPDPRILAISPSPRPTSLHGRQVLLESHPVANLRLPSGRIIACDPDDYFLAERTPFTTAVPPGSYPVYLNIVDAPEARGMSPRVASAGLAIREEQATSWELALLPGQDPRLLLDGETYGFGVDSGTACFMDAATHQSISVGDLPERDEQEMNGVHVSFLGDPTIGADLIAYDSGWGDGRYPVWIGRGADRGVTAIVADMLLF